jgi:rhodanese-related sulfurtransferase
MKVSVVSILFLLILSSASAQTQDSIKVKLLSPAAFLSEYQKSENALLVDVREFFEYRKSRIKNAINMPSSENLEMETDTINKSQKMFFYCTSGFRSKRVAKYFSEKGFVNLYSLDGGINAWKKEKMAVDRKRLKKLRIADF